MTLIFGLVSVCVHKLLKVSFIQHILKIQVQSTNTYGGYRFIMLLWFFSLTVDLFPRWGLLKLHISWYNSPIHQQDKWQTRPLSFRGNLFKHKYECQTFCKELLYLSEESKRVPSSSSVRPTVFLWWSPSPGWSGSKNWCTLSTLDWALARSPCHIVPLPLEHQLGNGCLLVLWPPVIVCGN